MSETDIIEVTNSVDERAERVKKRATSPKEKITSYFIGNNFDSKIKAHKDFVLKMVNNPYDTYVNFKTRLENILSNAVYLDNEKKIRLRKKNYELLPLDTEFKIVETKLTKV